MSFVIEDNIHSVCNVRIFKETNIVWESTGYNEFIIIHGKCVDDVSLKNETLQQNILNSKINSHTNKDDTISGICIHYVNRTQKDTGGFNSEGIPGVYAVYGCEFDEYGNIKNVYYNNSNVRSVTVLVNLSISIENFYIKKKSLFSKKTEYSGYKRITINRAIKNMPNNSVSYIVNGFKGNIPIEVLTNGGEFYVKCNENENIEISGNNGISVQIV